MKRALIALVAVGFVVAAVSIGRAHSGDDAPSKAEPVDVSRKLDRDVTKEQTKRQSEQVLKAQEELKEKVDEFASEQSHTFVVTVREETPGAVWVVGKVDGKPACVTPSKGAPTMVEVHVADIPDESELTSKVAPLEATLLGSGACEASLKLFVPRMEKYEITVVGPGHGKFDPVRVRKDGEPQKVALVG